MFKTMLMKRIFFQKLNVITNKIAYHIYQISIDTAIVKYPKGHNFIFLCNVTIFRIVSTYNIKFRHVSSMNKS